MTDDEVDKDVHGWLRSQELDATADYVRRGRQFSGLALPDLTAQWAGTFKDGDEHIRSKELRNLSSDYASEFALRGTKPPMDLIQADFAKIQKAMKTMLKGMSKEAYNDLAAKVADDV